MTAAWNLSLSEAATEIAFGRLTPSALLDATLQRISEVEPHIRAWARLQTDDARKDAWRLTERQRAGAILGPLHGIPVGVKDVFDTAGLETTCGSKLMAGFVPTDDATAVARLRSAGAVILGKTHTTEFAYAEPSPARNPWATNHTPGGSSSGSAAALAARMCYGALGSQTAGSIVRPAAFCGVVGLKPTFGRVSRHGMHPLAWSLDHAGPMARTVKDVALMLEIIAGPDPKDPATLLVPAGIEFKGLDLDAPRVDGVRVGVPNHYFYDQLESEAANIFCSAVRIMEDVGCRLCKIDLLPDLEEAMQAHETIHEVETATVHMDTYHVRPEGYAASLARVIEVGLKIPASSYARAQQVRGNVIRHFWSLFDDVDVIATPAAPGAAPEGLISTGSSLFNWPFSFTGFPCLNVPCGFTLEGLPIGLQLAGRLFDERILLRTAAAYEKTTEWNRHVPVFLGRDCSG